MSGLLNVRTKNHRRNFLKRISTGIAASMAFPAIGGPNQWRFDTNSLDGTIDEKYWEMVKQQFAIPANKMMVNSANLCPSPYFINERVTQLSRDLAKDVSFQNRSKYGEMRKGAVQLLAKYLGVSEDEIAISRNTSESNNIVVNGFDFKKGDEVIIWEQNHPTNRIAWYQRAKRLGFTVKEIAVPVNPHSKNDLLSPFTNAITSRTRMIAFSHISNVSGIALPAEEICKSAREKGIMTLIDGAQAFGFLNLDLKSIGCDFYTGSTHKWLMGPMENGILYVHKDQ